MVTAVRCEDEGCLEAGRRLRFCEVPVVPDFSEDSTDLRFGDVDAEVLCLELEVCFWEGGVDDGVACWSFFGDDCRGLFSFILARLRGGEESPISFCCFAGLSASGIGFPLQGSFRALSTRFIFSKD